MPKIGVEKKKSSFLEPLPRTVFNGGKWSSGRFNSFVTSTLRAGARRWPPKYETLKAAQTEKKINKKSGRLAQHFLCGCCGGEFTSKDVQVDHIKPVVDPTKGFKSWDSFVENLFCESSNLQVLCLDCHRQKTNQEKLEKKNANK